MFLQTMAMFKLYFRLNFPFYDVTTLYLGSSQVQGQKPLGQVSEKIMFRIDMLVLILSITNISLLLPQTKLKIVQCLILKHPDAYKCRNAVLNHCQWLGTIPPMTHTNVKMSVVCRNVTCNHFISDWAEEQPWTG